MENRRAGDPVVHRARLRVARQPGGDGQGQACARRLPGVAGRDARLLDGSASRRALTLVCDPRQPWGMRLAGSLVVAGSVLSGKRVKRVETEILPGSCA